MERYVKKGGKFNDTHLAAGTQAEIKNIFRYEETNFYSLHPLVQ